MGNGADPVDRKPAAAEIVLEPILIEGQKKASPGPGSETPPKTSLSPQELKKLAQLLGPLGADWTSWLDVQGEIRPEKLEAAKQRVAEAIRLQVQKAESRGAKASWPVYFRKTFLPALIRDSEFPLLPKDAQIELFKSAGIEGKDELLAALEKPWGEPAKRFAHFVRLQAQLAEKEGKPAFHCARLYEKAAALDPEDLSLALVASRAKLRWAEATQEPQSRRVLFQQALAQIDSVLKKEPDRLEALSQKGEALTLLGRPEEALRLYDEVLKGKSFESMVPIYDLEQEGAVDARVIHLAAAQAMQRWAELAGKVPALRGLSGAIFLEALGHLEAVLENNPKDALALERKAELLSGLGAELAAGGESEASERLLREAREIRSSLLRGKIEDLLQTAESGEAAAQAAAKTRLEAMLPELEAMVPGDSLRSKLEDLALLAKAYRGLSMEAPCDEAKKRLAAGIQELRHSLRLEPGAKPNAESFKDVEALIRWDRRMGDQATLAKDLEIWTGMVDAAGPELLDAKAKLAQYGEIFRAYHALKGQVDGVELQMDALRGKVIACVDQAEALIPQKESRYGAGERVGEIYKKLIQMEAPEAEALFPLLAPEKLLQEVEPLVRVDLAYRRAREIQDPEARRAALLQVLQDYGRRKDVEKVEEILRHLEVALPFRPEDPANLPERIRMHSAIVAATHDCGLEVEEKYRKYCEEEVRILRAQVEAGATGTGTPRSPSQRISDLLLIRGYYEGAGDIAEIARLEPLFRLARTEGEAQLAGGDPPLEAKARVLLAGQLAQASWLLFASDLEKESWNPERTEAEERQAVTARLQGSLARWRREIAEAGNLDPAWKYEQVRGLLFFTASLGGKEEKNVPHLEEATFAAELQAAKDLLRPLLGEGARAAFAETPSAGDAKAEVGRQERVLADLEALLDKADPQDPASMDFLAGLDFSDVGEFAKLDLSARRQWDEAQAALGAKDVATWIREVRAGKAEAAELERGLEAARQAARTFAALGLSEPFETAMRPILELARCPEVPAEERCRSLLGAGQAYLAAGQKDKALEILGEVAALDGGGASPELRETAQLAKGIRLLNGDPPKPEAAMEIFQKLEGSETARDYLAMLGAARLGHRRAQCFQLIQTVMLHHAAALRDDGYERQASGVEKNIDPFLRQLGRKLDSGECKTLGQAIEAVSKEPGFDFLPGFLLETWAGNSIRNFAEGVSDFKQDDRAFLGTTLKMAEYLAGEGDPYDISPALKDMFGKDPAAKRPLADFMEKLPSLKSFAQISSALMYATPFGVAFFSPNFSSVKKHWMGLVPGFIGGAIGKSVFKSAFLSFAGSRISSPFLKSAGTFLAEEAGTTLGMTFGRMGAQLLMSGRLAGLTWEGFWREMGDSLLMSLCLRGAGVGVRKLGGAASRLPWLRSAGAQGVGIQALSPAARRALGALGYVGNVGAFAGAEAAGELIGLREGAGLDFFTRMFRAWVTQVEMGSAQRQAEVLKGVVAGKRKPAAAMAAEGDAKVPPAPGAPSRKPPGDGDLIHTGKKFELPVLADVVVLDGKNKRPKPAGAGRVALREGDIVETGKPGDPDFHRQVFQDGKLQALGPEPAKLPMPSVPPRSPFRQNLATDKSANSLWSRISGAKSLSELKKWVRESALPGAQTEFRLLESCLRGETEAQRLAPGLREKALELMGRYARELSQKLPNGLVPRLVNEASLQLPPEEIRYRACREFGTLLDKTAAARNIDQLIEVVEKSPVANPEGIPKADLLQKLKDYRAGTLPLQEMPRGFGLRQKLRDLKEGEIDRFYEAEQKDSFPLPADPAARQAVSQLDAAEAALFAGLPTSGFQGEWKAFSPVRIVETLHQVLERGKPVETITVEGGLRDKVKDRMENVVNEARRLYPVEWSKVVASKRNFFTGEAFGGSPDDPKLRQQEMPLNAVYRFARMLLNEKSGRPIFGMPSFPERKALRDFAVGQLKAPQVKDYADAQAAIRDHFTRLTPEFQRAFQAADPKTRALLVEAFFGSAQHRQMDDPKQAFQLAKFLARSGAYRELGVTVEFDGVATYTNLTLGAYRGLSSETDHMHFVMHTHPEEYLGRDKKMMTGYFKKTPGSAKTLVFDEGRQSPDTRNVMFSEKDAQYFVGEAKYLFGYRQQNPRADISLFYDDSNPQRPVYRNWMQHVHGLAVAEVELDATGNPQTVRVRYARYQKPGLDRSHKWATRSLRDFVANTLHLTPDIREVRPEDVEATMPH